MFTFYIKEKNNDRKFFEFFESNIFQRYSITFNNIDTTNIINIIDIIIKKSIYYYLFDFELSTNFNLLTNFDLLTNIDMFENIDIFENIDQFQSQLSFNVNIQRFF